MPHINFRITNPTDGIIKIPSGPGYRLMSLDDAEALAHAILAAVGEARGAQLASDPQS